MLSSFKKALTALVIGTSCMVAIAQDQPKDESKKEEPKKTEAPLSGLTVGHYENKKDVIEAAQAAKAAREKARASSNVQPGATIDKEQIKALAKEGQQRGRDEMARMQRDGDLKQLGDKTQEYVSTPKGKETPRDGEEIGKPNVEGRVVVAISSSMPREMIREYFAQLDNIPEAIVVIRGGIGGMTKVQPTMKWAAEMRKKDPTCERKCVHNNVKVIIDPLLYTALKIDKVPAVAYLHGVQDIGHCEQEQFAAATVIFGATSVESALKHMRKEGVLVPPSVMSKFESKGWERKKT